MFCASCVHAGARRKIRAWNTMDSIWC
jgi:hypothetical protein